MEQLSQTAPRRSFWERPEGSTGKALIGAGAAAALYVIWRYDILGKLIELATDAIHLTILGATLAALWMILSSERVHSLVFYGFQMISRWITSFFIEIDPVAILKAYIGQMRKRRDQVQDRLGRISGVKKTLEGEIKRSKKEMGRALELAHAAKNVGDEDGLDAHAEIAGRRKRNIEDYMEMHAQVEQVETLLSRVLKRVDYHIRNAEDETNELVRKHQIARETSEATRSAREVLGYSDLLEIRNEAADRIRERYGNAIGELETLIQMTDFDNAVDLEQVAFRADGRRQLETLEKALQQLESGQSPALLSAGPIPTAVPAEGSPEWAALLRRPQ